MDKPASLKRRGKNRTSQPLDGTSYYVGIGCAILVALLCLLPAVVTVAGGFSEGIIPRDFEPSVEPWRRALSSEQSLSAIGFSFLLSLRAPVGLAIAFTLAWYLARHDVFGKRTILFTLWLAFFLPILPATLGWILVLDPEYGWFNTLAQNVGLVDGPLLNIYSLLGITWVHLTLTTVPIMTILIEPAQRAMDASYEEAAIMSGGSRLSALTRVTIPLIAPTLLTALIAGLIRSLEAFEIEQLLGAPAGIFVYSTRIFNLLRFSPSDEPQAMALSSFFLVILFFAVVAYRSFLNKAGATATLTGKGARLTPKNRTRGSYLLSVGIFLALSLTVVLPFAMVLLGSFNRLFGFYNLDSPWTGAHWTETLESGAFLNSLTNSALIGVVVAVVGTAVYVALSWFLARHHFWGRSGISLAIWLPWAIPGVLLGGAFLRIFLGVPGLSVLYGSMAPLVVVLVVGLLPLATHMLEASINQISPELEEASRISGASRLETLWRVTLPLIAPMTVSVFIIAFMTAIKDISSTVIVATPGTQTLPLLMFHYATSGELEQAAVVGVVSVAIAMVMAILASRLGDRQALR